MRLRRGQVFQTGCALLTLFCRCEERGGVAQESTERFPNGSVRQPQNYPNLEIVRQIPGVNHGTEIPLSPEPVLFRRASRAASFLPIAMSKSCDRVVFQCGIQRNKVTPARTFFIES